MGEDSPSLSALLLARTPNLIDERLAGVQLAPDYFGIVGEVEEGVSIDSIRLMKFLVGRGCIMSPGGTGRGWYATVLLHALSSSKLVTSIRELSLKFMGYLLGDFLVGVAGGV